MEIVGNDCLFRLIRREEVPCVLSLIRERMQWMDERGIRHWNEARYDLIYPLSHYEAECEAGRLFVLEERQSGRIVCAGALMEHDERWQDGEDALYLHHFVSEAGERGFGALFLRCAERYAAERGKGRMRLDSAEGNEALAGYYAARGYRRVGRCREGGYRGILYEKTLTPVG